jgi:cystathionine beta-lyase family protein involved in aluminum resistance
MIDAFAEALGPFEFPSHVAREALAAAAGVQDAWRERDARALGVTAKVVRAFARAGLTDAHLQSTTGYGYHDAGREAYESILAELMGAPAALARIQLVSGTQAIVSTVAALAGRDGRFCSLTGRPYDTLRLALVDHPDALFAGGDRYEEVAWVRGARLDESACDDALARRPAVAFIQRSRGYAPRASASVADIARLIAIVRRRSPATNVVVDNCYGEFVELEEPGDVGADAIVGSLIKNPGGGMAPTGAYVAGSVDVVEKVARRMFAPGLGAALGPGLDTMRWLFAGLHRAPKTVAESLKIMDFAAALFARLGYAVEPEPGAARTDIIQAIRLGSARRLTAFAEGLQRLLPVNPRARPEPGPVPGYADPVIMAGGAFVSGSTIELSCDAPLREPFDVYLQGGLDLAHGMLAVTSAAAAVGAA